MSDFLYILDSSSKKHTCPACGKKRFVRYIDTSTSEYLPENYGRCDREVNCGYFLNPYKDGYKIDDQENNTNFSVKINKPCNIIPNNKKTSAEISFIPYDIFKQSRTAYDKNNFVLFLGSLFDSGTVTKLIGSYHLGTSCHWPGANVFWQVDEKGRIRTGKIMLYNSQTGRRIKEPFNHISWAHKALKLEGYNLQQCFFGGHLLPADLNSPVAIVESEKTAIIASVYFPDFIWLAVGSLSNLTSEKCNCLKDRKAFLFPDLNCFEKWSVKAAEITSQLVDVHFEISDLLEKEATAPDREGGLDLADYLIRFDYHEINTSYGLPEFYPVEKDKVNSIPQGEKREKSDLIKINFLKPTKQAIDNEPWNIAELETFFNQTTLPDHPIQLNSWTKINNPSLFVKSHFDVIKSYINIPNYKPYYDRLFQIKKLLTNQAAQ